MNRPSPTQELRKDTAQNNVAIHSTVGSGEESHDYSPAKTQTRPVKLNLMSQIVTLLASKFVGRRPSAGAPRVSLVAPAQLREGRPRRDSKFTPFSLSGSETL